MTSESTSTDRPVPSDEGSVPVGTDRERRMRHVVKFSGGAGSWATAVRVAERHGTDELILLFTDTLHESPDTYRFIVESAADLFGVELPREVVPDPATFPPFTDRDAYKAHLARVRAAVATHLPGLVWLSDGRDIWDVFRDERFLGNSRKDPCSKILKRLLADRWLRDNMDPTTTVVYVGIDWTEKHRFDDGKGGGLGPRRAKDGWTYEAPLTEPPLVWRPAIAHQISSRGLTAPGAYRQDYSHNNCNRLCVKAGHEHYRNLLSRDRDLYVYYESKEQEMRELVGSDVSMLTDRAGDNRKKVLTLRTFRERIEAKDAAGLDFLKEFAPVKEGVGGCGCMVEPDEEPDTTSVVAASMRRDAREALPA